MTNPKEPVPPSFESWGWLRRTLYGKKTLLTVFVVLSSLGQGQLELMKQQVLQDNPAIADAVALEADQVLSVLEVKEHPLFLEAKKELEETRIRLETVAMMNEQLERGVIGQARDLEKLQEENATLKDANTALGSAIREQENKTLLVKDEALKTTVALQAELAQARAQNIVAQERLQTLSTTTRKATPNSIAEVMYRLQNPPMPPITRPSETER